MASRSYTAAMCFILALLHLACGGNARAQELSAPTSLTVTVGGTLHNYPIVLGGQSNAVYLNPYLVSAYPQGVSCVCRGVTALRAWDDDGDLWPPLAAALQGPITGMVWWQGEQDTLDNVTTAEYAAHLTDFFRRVRAIQPGLLIVVVEIRFFNGSQNPSGGPIRLAQEMVTAADPQTILVHVDDLQGEAPPQEEHLIPATYPIAAQRILDAIRSR